MIQLLRDAIGRVEVLQRDLARLKAKHVNSETDKNAIRTVVDDYFRSIRPSIAIYPVLHDQLETVDGCFQEVLSLSHRRTPVAAYKRLLTKCKSSLVSLESQSLTQSRPDTTS